MTPTRPIALLAVFAVVGLTVAPLASGAVANPFLQAEAGDSETATPNASVGTLMQASAADAESTIDSGMFEAAYDRAANENRPAVVRHRTAELESQITELEAERAQLENQRENLSQGAYKARMAKLAVEIASLERSIDRTERRAADVGVSEDALETLRENATSIRQAASEQAGPGIAALARGLSGNGGLPGFTPEPPDERGQSDGTGGAQDDGETGNDPAKQSPTDPGSPLDKSNDNPGDGTGTESG
ncbi:hypothetical protein [Natrinema caseinilyticum]|uniref:hypothetical protein n=1 Tax=Natrinema caseinilyticum TaxID=2961570 RepID=UPI0020C59E23|nr:hypothetical protein [Natrinema caseinilyticum]